MNLISNKTMSQFGFVACFLYQPEKSLPIFEYLECTVPNDATSDIGFAVNEISKGNIQGALKRLNHAMDNKTDNLDALLSVYLTVMSGIGREKEAIERIDAFLKDRSPVDFPLTMKSLHEKELFVS
ncbi:MAG: hypothetical protein HWE34_17595 [Methylocystaceae bacterium]|nr:hypothetical protein [Methylocystaceae bacterium]